jgi:hypothetical protein
MVSTAVIPRICKLVEGGVFDAYSDANVKRIIDLSDEVAISLEHGNAKYLVSFLHLNLQTNLNDNIGAFEDRVDCFSSSYNGKRQPDRKIQIGFINWSRRGLRPSVHSCPNTVSQSQDETSAEHDEMEKIHR